MARLPHAQVISEGFFLKSETFRINFQLASLYQTINFIGFEMAAPTIDLRFLDVYLN